MSNALPAHLKKLFDETVVSPENKDVSPSNVVAMPGSAVAKVQDSILKMMLRGRPLSEIAEDLGIDITKVETIARSEWVAKKLEEQVLQDGGEKTLHALMRINVFNAIMRLGILSNSSNGSVSLGACRTILEYTLVPMKDKDMLKNSASKFSKDPEKELAELEKEKERLINKK